MNTMWLAYITAYCALSAAGTFAGVSALAADLAASVLAELFAASVFAGFLALGFAPSVCSAVA